MQFILVDSIHFLRVKKKNGEQHMIHYGQRDTEGTVYGKTENKACRDVQN